jgi:hypothetical protein
MTDEAAVMDTLRAHLAKLRELKDHIDPEEAHMEADEELLRALRLLSSNTPFEGVTTEIVNAWYDIMKWYG